MKFELTNEQRCLFGIEPIDANWEVKQLNEFSKIYFDKNDIIRRLISYEYGYAEREYDIQTKDRIIIEPRTKKGKQKKLTYSTIINGPKPINVGFTYLENQSAYVTNFNVDRSLFNSSYLFRRLSWEGLNNWISNLSKTMSSDIEKEIKEFKHLKRQRIKYKPGDLFAYKIDSSTYGFGQILLDINKVRKNFKYFNNASLGSVFGASVLARIYCHTSKSKSPQINSIISSAYLPSIILRDNQIYYGEYEIIGHSPLKESEFDFPISFGLANNVADPNHYLHFGFVTKKQPKEKTPTDFIMKDGVKSLDSPYRNNGSMGIIPFTLDELNQTQEKGIEWFWENVGYFSFKDDLRNPKNKNIRNRILTHFQIDPNWEYDEMRKQNRIKQTLEIINDSA